MATLSQLIEAIRARLAATEGLNGVTILVEDPQELGNKIDQALGDVGALILIGQPSWRNGTPESMSAAMAVKVEIAVGENPTIWRDAAAVPPKPVAMDMAQIITLRLQGYLVNGFTALRVMDGDPVPDKQRQLFEVAVETKWLVRPTDAGP